jgi:hypothetical protein
MSAIPINDIAHKIQAIVADADMNPTIAIKAARAVVDGKLDLEEVTAILDGLTHQRTAGTLKKPGAYFCASLKRAFTRNQIPW